MAFSFGFAAKSGLFHLRPPLDCTTVCTPPDEPNATLNSIPDAVRRFVLTSVPTVPHLEAILLLHRPPVREWSIEDVAGRLYIAPAAAAQLLEDLQASGLAARADGAWRFADAPGLSALLDAVDRTYTEQLVELSRLIHSKTDRRAQQFADAFAFKKDEKR